MARGRKKKQRFERAREVRRLARERVGAVPSSRVIEPKSRREKPKHKKPPASEEAEDG